MLFGRAFWQSGALLSFLSAHGHATPTGPLDKRAAVDDWIATEYPIAMTQILQNIGPYGSDVAGAAAGIVIASPSNQNPNYFYSWIRDAALTFKALTDEFIRNGDYNLRLTIQDYISAQAKLQTVSNPSGGFSNGAGLGEPKFNANMSAFTGDWGRPQRDGPALRAIALMAFGKWLIANGQTASATNIVWPVVKNDLAYVAQYWNQTGFDLWEEVQGSSFFTTAAQYRALVEGSAFAKSIGQSCAACDSQAPNILCFQQTYWNGQWIVSNINTGSRRTGKDINSIITSNNMFDSAATCDDVTFQPCSSRALANHKQVTDSFRFYGVNSGIAQGKGVAIGRYAEDVYYNGNPWYLATLAAAEQLYLALWQFNKIGSITIDSTSLAFWKDLYSSAATGTYSKGSSTYTALTNALKSYADGYVSVTQKNTPNTGLLAEQFDKNSGVPLSAQDLTWSFAAVVTMKAARDGNAPGSWGAAGVKAPTGSCSSGGASGSYTAATNTAWPSFTCTTASTVDFAFSVSATTSVGTDVYVVGSIPELGSWDTTKAVKLDARWYTDSRPMWNVGGVKIKAGTKFEYKYFKKTGSAVAWESDPNRSYTVPSTCRTGAAVVDSWK